MYCVIGKNVVRRYVVNTDVVFLDICDLVDFTDQPFKVLDDYAMDELTESIKMVGVLVTVIVRKTEDDKYEIISGHRRKRACDNSRD